MCISNFNGARYSNIISIRTIEHVIAIPTVFSSYMGIESIRSEISLASFGSQALEEFTPQPHSLKELMPGGP